MELSPKKAKLSKVLIRLCDAFTRTDENIICPLIKAENSVRVLYKLQKKVLLRIVQKAGATNRLTDPTFLWKSAASGRKMEGNLFVEYSTSQSFKENNLKQYQKTLAQKLTEESKVKHVLIDCVRNTEEIIPQPIILETSFELHKLKLCYEGLIQISEEFDEGLDLIVVADTIKSNSDDLRGQYTKFAVLSQNADNKKEYSENNRNLKLPQDIMENKTVEEMEEDEYLPDVVKDVLKTALDKKQHARSVIEPLCHQLPRVIQQSNNLYSNLGDYFSTRNRIDVEPFILAQKELEGSYESTTKCIIHLRYGTVYQMSVNYFTEEELQQQLFDLVTLNGEDSSEMDESNEHVKDRALDCLKARFKILTDHKIPSDLQEMKGAFLSPKDIVLSDDVQKFAGKTELYFGNGRDAKNDRLAMQALVRQLTTSQEEDKDKADEYKKRIAAVKEIVIYLPSKILYGGKEILEMPGTDDSDPIAMDFIKTALNEVDAVIVVSDFAFKIAEKEVKDMLFGSGFANYWKENPCNYKLMLLAYPEKNHKWQFGKDNSEAIKKLEDEEKKKRNAELNLISKTLRMDTLPDDMKNSIITAYILPVLHTSILAQTTAQGEEYKIFQNDQTFLKYTGISNLITIIDEFVSSRQNVTTEEVKAQISHFHYKIHSGRITAAARSVLHVLNNRETKCIVESKINRNIEELLISFDKSIKEMLYEVAETELETVLRENIEQATTKWKQYKEKIKSVGVFSPHFYGRNPVYKVLLNNIFFDGLEEKKGHIFQEIKIRIDDLLKKYKRKILGQCREDLNNLLGDNHDSFTLEFVQNTIENELDGALAWYLGKKRRPFNEKTMKKCFEDCQNQSFKKYILVPNYNINHPLETAKQNTELNIENCIMDIKEPFLIKLSALHKERTKSLYGKLVTSKGVSKMWQRLVQQMKQISRLRADHKPTESLDDLFHMMSANLHEP
ncbi:uncharacterized protein LOC108698044 isoform X2 [Xenopus laevis]|uniref:Uncharacterized protein LOC108698044 isoform X2 n=1 Tax=Xenopus laevis TaxID=8355 RepID=A0A8J1MST9_XENLA|nr:uncharacterized protein LOC108698044 isoform X2 [Xenopus laevis]